MSQNRDGHHGLDDAALEAILAAARTAKPDPLPEDFGARLLTGATAAMPRRAGAIGRGGSWLLRLRDALAGVGGAPGLAGVAAAGLAGVWIGFSGPGMTGDLMTRFWQGAASVSNPVSALVDGDPLSGTGDDLLSLMSESE